MRKLLLVLLLCCSGPDRTGGAVPSVETGFRHLGISEGFNQTNVTSLYQDETGTIWAAGVGGVVRYRGLLPEDPFIPPPDSNAIYQPLNVLGIFGEKAGKVYFHQSRRIIEYDLRKETFVALLSDSLLNGRQISAVCMRDGWVYAAAGDRVIKAGPDGRRIELLLPPMSEVSAIASLSSGALYVGTLHSGLYRIGNRDTVERVIESGSKISALFEDSRGCLWVCTRSEGLYRIDTEGRIQQFSHDPHDAVSIADNYVRCICEDNDGRLWIGMMFGLDCYDPRTDTFYHFGRSDNPYYGMRNLTVECIMKDRRGAIWFGSFYTGVSYFDPDKTPFHTVPFEAADDTTWTIVADMTLDKRGNLWVGTSDKGLYFYDRKRRVGRFFNMGNSGIPSDNVKSVRYDTDRDQLWLGMFMGGVCSYDIDKGRFIRIPITDRDGRSEITEIVHGLTREGDTLYAATYAGVYGIDMQSRKAEMLLDLPRVFNVLSGPAGALYVVTGQTNFRAYRRKNDGQYELWFNQIIRQNMITSLFCDSRGRAWVGTTRGGALLFDAQEQSFKVYDKVNCGIASNHVSSISETADGLMILGTNVGLSLLDADQHKSENYNISNGFPLLSLENGCIWRSESGEVLCGGVNGIVSIHENELIRPERAPQIFFASLSVNDNLVQAGDRTGILTDAMPYTRAISLGHKYSLVDIAFGTDNSVDFNLGDYQYRLIGYDEEWRALHDRNIRYMNLPPGSYTLSVRNRSTKLVGGNVRIDLDMRIYPPFYASIYAYVLYVLLIIAITTLVIRYYYSKKQLEQSLAIERMEKEQQERVTQWKLVFFTNISHEFRTPLTLILGQLDLLVRSEIPSSVKGYMLSVRRNALRLRDLVNELIDFRKQEQGYLTLKVARQDLVGYLKDVCDIFSEYSRIKQISLGYDPRIERVETCFDPVQLQKVFYNLLGNAFKHTEKGGLITVMLQLDGGNAVIKVSDTGQGIDPKHFDTIFERFYHYDADSQERGVGIGLALSKGIVQLHGGRIEVESEVGVGSTFTVTLPRDPDFSGNPNVEIVEKTEYARPAVVDGYVPVPRPIPGSDEKPCLLVAEDDEELRDMFDSIFSQSYRVLLAPNGAEGLKLAQQEQPDLIVSDVLMPEMSGTEMCARLKSDFATCHIPIVLLTALGSSEQRILGLESGADDYISKPFDMDVLLVRCNTLVRNRRLLQQKFMEGSIEPVPVATLSSNSMDEEFVRKTLDLIGQYLDSQKLTVDLMCRELALSRTAFFLKIKGVFGQTPTELIQSIRLREAARMLRECPELKIVEITERVGINSLQYFGKLFKSHYHCTPSEYKSPTNKAK